VTRITLARLAPDSDGIGVVQDVLEDAPGYALATTGRLPAGDAAVSLFGELPDGRRSEDKHVFALIHGDDVVGCADVLKGHPDEDAVFVGLLVIREGIRRIGLGTAAYARLEEAFREWGSRRARLAVVEDNRGALGFWESVGFAATGEVRDYRAGVVESRLILMEKDIRAGDDTDASRVSR